MVACLIADRPRRIDAIDFVESATGYVVYDSANNRVHQLSLAATAILDLCNGERTIAEIVELFRDTTPAEQVEACVALLYSEHLVS